MKLTYRGVHYDYTPAAVEMQEDALAGKYRDAALKLRTKAARVPVLQPALDLIYRGIRYQTGATQATVAQSNVATPNAGLIYRGIRYTMGEAQVVNEVSAVPHSESITEQIRELVIQRRQKAEQREQAVLERFEEAI